MSDGPLVDETLRLRLIEVAARHADGVPVEGAARARRTARRRAATRTGLVAAAVAAVLVGVPVALFGSLSADRGMVAPAVTPAPDPTTTSTEPTPGEVSSAPTMTTTRTITSSVTETIAGDELPGVPVQVYAPGAALPVVGVEFDDVLNIRSLPGTDGDVVGGVDPTGEVTATGGARDVDGSRWVEVTVDTTTGWVSARFLASGTGPVEDRTALAIERHAGVPTATSMPELAQVVADALAPDGVTPQVSTAVAATSGDLDEITVDSLGLEDDSILGYRLHVFAIEDSGVYSLRTVEATTLCARGVTPDGLCV